MKPSVYWLLVFIPATVVLEHAGQLPAPVIFFSAALAIVPIAALIVRSTEQVATRTGDAVGGLLNATFGNAPELIIALAALRAGYPGHGARLHRRRDPRQPAPGARDRLPPRRTSLPRPEVQSRGCADLQHHDAARQHQPRRTQRVQPVLRAGEHHPSGTAAQSRHRRGAAHRVRAVSVVLAQDAPGHVRERRGEEGRGAP